MYIIQYVASLYIRNREANEWWCRNVESLTCPGCSQAVWYLACWHSSLTLLIFRQVIRLLDILVWFLSLRRNFDKKEKLLWEVIWNDFHCDSPLSSFFLPCHITTPHSSKSTQIVIQFHPQEPNLSWVLWEKITTWELWRWEIREGKSLSSKSSFQTFEHKRSAL